MTMAAILLLAAQSQMRNCEIKPTAITVGVVERNRLDSDENGTMAPFQSPRVAFAPPRTTKSLGFSGTACNSSRQELPLFATCHSAPALVRRAQRSRSAQVIGRENLAEHTNHFQEHRLGFTRLTRFQEDLAQNK